MSAGKRSPAPASVEGSRWREALSFGLRIAVVAAVVAGLMALYRQSLHESARLNPAEYEGRIVDKSLTIRETMLGSKFSRRLVIEGKGGGRFEVAAGADVYERAQVGMWVKGGSAGVELGGHAPAAEGRGR
jgi:hypothetical protein